MGEVASSFWRSLLFEGLYSESYGGPEKYFNGCSNPFANILLSLKKKTARHQQEYEI